MSMKKVTRAENLDLLQLVDGIENGEVALPNFQRDFDWTVPNIRSLLGTVLRGWPIGSLLLIEGARDREFYDPRPFENAGPLRADLDYIVLDGQQRLTALFYALRDRGPFVYAVRVGKTDPHDSIDDLDRAIVALKRDAWPTQPAAQLQAGLLPVSVLGEASDFYAWRDTAVPREDTHESDRLTRIYRDHLSGLHKYTIPAVLIGSNVGPEAVARIFERVNRTGIRLGTFDLMVAKSFTPTFNLRKRWDEAQDDNDRLVRFLDGDGLPILTSLALRQRSDVRQAAVLAMPGSAIEDGWRDAVHHFEKAIDFLVDQLGILTPDWLPYRAMLPVLAAVNVDLPLEANSELIERWFWATAVGKRYDVGSNTAAIADFKLLKIGRDPIDIPPVIVRELALESTKAAQGSFHRTFMAATARALHKNGQLPAGNSQEVRAISCFDRGDVRIGPPPLHLRTLSFYVNLVHDKSSKLVTPRQQFGDLRGSADLHTALQRRLDLFAEFVSELIGDRVRVVSAEEAATVTDLVSFGNDLEEV